MDISHEEWAQNRVNVIRDYFGREYFQGKTLLELGSMFSYIGNEFSKLGCDVTCVEAKAENIREAKLLYPHLRYIEADLDKEEWPFGDFDIILHMGLLYHQANPEYCLRQSQEHCKVLILESEVVDSDKLIKELSPKRDACSQGFNNECKISVGYIESMLHNATRLDDKRLNHNYHHYDWIAKNEGHYTEGQRRFWICQMHKV